MSRQSQRTAQAGAELLFVDGFAGPGSYAGGEDGSPILALKSVLSHSHAIHVPVSFLFIEEDPERHRILEQKVGELKDEITNSPRVREVDIRQGDCEGILSDFLAKRKQVRGQIGPAFFYLDQFGYSDISIGLLQTIMRESLCEVFSYLNWDHLGRFLSDSTKWPSVTKALGDDKWREVLDKEHNDRSSFILRVYRDALCTRGRSKYVWQFAMCDDTDRLLYWLFFCTNNVRGLEEMKRAMWRVDPSGGFRFSDKDDPSQLCLFSGYTQEALAEELTSSLRGKTLSVAQIREFILSETPAYQFKKSLGLLERTGTLKIIDPPPRRRRFTFADDQMRVHFVADSPN